MTHKFYLKWYAIHDSPKENIKKKYKKHGLETQIVTDTNQDM